MTKTIKCPECEKIGDEEVDIIVPDDACIGDILECPLCGAELEILSKDPLQVSVIEEEK